MKESLEIPDLDFHDGSLLDFTYSQKDRWVKCLVTGGFLEKKGPIYSNPFRLFFQQVFFLLCTDMSPWGPSEAIFEITQEEQIPYGSLEIPENGKFVRMQLQSGDDIYIGYETLTIKIFY